VTSHPWRFTDMTTGGSSKYRGTKEYCRIFAKLIGAAESGQVMPYKEVGRILGIKSFGDHYAREVGRVLGEISEDEHRNGRPMLSAIAHNEAGSPGQGFYTCARDLGLLTSTDHKDELAFWEIEQRKVYQEWKPVT
jgi:hypothetical protein